MNRALLLLLVGFASMVARADTLDGVYELAKVNDKAAADLLRAPDTVWARYLLSYAEGKVTARIQLVHKTKEADKFLSCDAAVTLPITWKGSSYSIADEVAAEGTFVSLARTKEGDRPKLSTEKKSCTVFLKKGTYKAQKTKEGAKLTTEAGDVFTLLPAEAEPKYLDILK
jgi:hypothetical protein